MDRPKTLSSHIRQSPSGSQKRRSHKSAKKKSHTHSKSHGLLEKRITLLTRCRDPAEGNFNVDTTIKCLRSLSAEPESLKSIYVKQNEAYKSVMTELKKNSDFSKLAIDHPARAFKNIQDRLYRRDEQGNEVMLKDSQKIVVPRGAQDEILKEQEF